MRIASSGPSSALASASSSDSRSAPHGFELAGDAVTHYAVNTAGYVQLFDSASATPDTTLVREPLPSSLAPPGMIAAFWDRFEPDDEMTTDVRVRTVGSSPSRRLVVQWTNWSQFATTDYMTLQLQLYEGSNAIEVHQCSRTGDAFGTFSGASASFGVQSMDRTRGHMHAYQTEDTISPSEAIRWDPR